MNSSSSLPDRQRWRELIQRHLLGTISVEESVELESALAARREARADFRLRCNVDAALRQHASTALDGSADRVPIVKSSWFSPRRWAIAVVALMGVGAIVSGLGIYSSTRTNVEAPTIFVGTLVGAQDCVWDGKAPVVGSRLTNAALTLKQGQATILFDSGARMVIGGGTLLRPNDANSAELLRGRATVHCPESAFGFNLTTPNSSLVDLGTEFGVDVSTAGTTELHVFEGEVELGSRPSANARNEAATQLVEAGQARRIVSTAVRPIAISRDSFPRDFPEKLSVAGAGRLIAMESFDYPTGALGANAGGDGWGSPWSGAILGNASSVPVGPGTMTNIGAGFPKPSGLVLLQSRTREVKRFLQEPIDSARDHELYISFFLRKIGQEESAPGHAALMLRSSTDPAAIIAVGVDTKNHFRVSNRGRNVSADVQCVEGRTYFLVARYDFHRELPTEVSLAVFDAEAEELTGEPVVWPVRNANVGTGSGFDLLTLRNNMGGVFEFDEVRVGTSWNAVTASPMKMAGR